MLEKNQSSIILWGVSISPYVRKIQIALEEKMLAYKIIETLPKSFLIALNQSVPNDFDRASPLGKIPALQVDNFCIADSPVIAKYLDAKYPDRPALYPKEPEFLARTLWFENYADQVFSEVAYRKIFSERVIKPNVFWCEINSDLINQATQNELPPLLNYLEKEVTQYDWLGGNCFTMADIALTTHLIGLEQAGFDLNPNNWNNLFHYKQKVLSRDSFKKICGLN